MPAEATGDLDVRHLADPGERLLVFGGVYSNHCALEALLDAAAREGVDRLLCLGDLGAFGPHPDKIFPLLAQARVTTLRGNYDDSIGRGLDDCQCGYTDPRDNRFARLSYRYTYENTASRHRTWMAGLPDQIRFSLGGRRVLACHGSPRRMNEFLWASNSPDPFLDRLAREAQADVVLCTHTGLPWIRRTEAGHLWVNVGALGRPANDGTPAVRYALIRGAGEGVEAQIRSLDYDHETLAREMEAEALPPEFVETIRTGWWTTCLEILPARERAAGRY